MDELYKAPAPDEEGIDEEAVLPEEPSALALEAIGIKEIQRATQTLQNYKTGKANLELKVVEDFQWYRQRHWDWLRDEGTKNQVRPASAWLFNCIANKHADFMDNYPSANILPREEGDKEEAKMLSSIIPVILDQCNYEGVYSDTTDDELIGGTKIEGVFWDKNKLNGLGDIAITGVDILNFFWEPGIQDIQKSRNVFLTSLKDNDLLEAEYPQLKGKLGTPALTVAEYVHDDTVDTSQKSVVVDWYYKRKVGGKTILHYCKYVNDTVLYATENDPERAESGMYAHGMYPFVVTPLYRIKDSIAGMSMVDIGRSCQEYIDRGDSAILKNMLANAKPRYFIPDSSSLNEDEFADTDRELIHISGTNIKDNVVPMQPNTLNNIYAQIKSDKIAELKEVTGNRDVSTGGTTSGVTAASAIAAMQEAGSKLSRDASKSAYRHFRQVILMVIELIRQFYDMPRTFRILGENGAEEYVTYDNTNIRMQAQEPEFDVDMGYKLPLFDVEITAQKASPYSKMAQNELALQLYQAGFFNPQLADQALACLDMMDFQHKDFVQQKIAQNGGMMQMIMQMQMQINTLQTALGGTPPGVPSPPTSGGAAPPQGNPFIEGLGAEGESPVTAKARQRTAEATAPN